MSRVLLIAEPEPSRDTMASVLAKAPHTVKAVAPGDLRIMAARDWDPDVIVMSMSLDSAALQARIGLLRDPTLSLVPFVVLGDSAEEARALGAAAFLRTDADDDDLLDVVGKLGGIKFAGLEM